MKYKINDKVYKINLDELKNIGSGAEGNIYEFNGVALKIFNSTRLRYGYTLSENKFKTMSKIPLDRFIMPSNLIYEKKNNSYKFVGHTMQLLKNNLPIYNFYSKDIKNIINEIKLLESDIDVLSDYKFKMYDFLHNFYYNGKLYMIDTSYYMEGLDIEKVYIHNKKSLNDFFIYNLLLKPTSNSLNLPNVPFDNNILLNFFDSNLDTTNLIFSDFLLNLYSNSTKTISDIQKKHVKIYIKNFIK